MKKERRSQFANSRAMHALTLTVENCIDQVVQHEIDTHTTFLSNHLDSGPNPREMKFFEYADIVCKHVPDNTVLKIRPEKRMMVSHSRQVMPTGIGSITTTAQVIRLIMLTSNKIILDNKEETALIEASLGITDHRALGKKCHRLQHHIQIHKHLQEE